LFLDALDCAADSSFVCVGDDISINGCQAEIDAFGNCASRFVGQPGS